ncbi:MAG TPA: NYN domain-containing protein [Nitriliruptorales bacterium]|nr:NYN domain-containing protein [Nitriliruptorales bacterium]
MQDGPTEERLALFIDYENLAIGARETGFRFEVGPLADVLAERGRLVVRRAYADWHLFSDDRRELVDGHVELIDIPQRQDSVRKNAADIKMAVDAMELAFTSRYVSTFVIVSGDSDFTPLVNKLRALDRRVIGVGIRGSTSAMLPPACDEFIFYDRLENAPRRDGRGGRAAPPATPRRTPPRRQADALHDLNRLITQTLSGLQRSSAGPVYASSLKRALLRKDPTFSEADHGFRAFSELLRHLESEGQVALSEGPAQGDPEVDFPSESGGEEQAFELLVDVVAGLEGRNGGKPPLSGLKDQLRKHEGGFSEKDFGYSGFLQFVKAASARGLIELEFDDDEGEYYLHAPRV